MTSKMQHLAPDNSTNSFLDRSPRSAPDIFGINKDEEGKTELIQITEVKSKDFLNYSPVVGRGRAGSSRTPPPQYSKVSEKLRQIGSSSPTVHRLQCGTFCGGKGCKYDNPSRWRKEETGVAFDGLFSHWVTDNILAMARPSTQLFTQYKLLDQFKEAGINAVINLQTSGEHAHCGPPQETSGFTYKPEDLMRRNIYYYNYSLPDYGTCSVENILDVVKVIDFSCLNGRVAIHCHAGLGRTGSAIACYLVYSERIGAEEAITKVRDKRPDSIQSRSQIELVIQFSLLLLSLWNLYPTLPSSFTLAEYMEKQFNLLHGEELEKYKHIPKVISVVCARIKELHESQSFQYHNIHYDTSTSSTIENNESIHYEDDETGEDTDSWLLVSVCSSRDASGLSDSIESCHHDEYDHLVQSLLGSSPCLRDKAVLKRLTIIKDEINNKWQWEELSQETNPTVLFSLLFTYLSHLKGPVIQLSDCYNPDFMDHLSKCQKAILMTILETIKLVVPSSHLITYFSSIAIHLIKFLCHCSSEDIEDNETTCHHLLHYIMNYYQ